MKSWACKICGTTGTEATSKGADRAWERHYYVMHSREES